MECAPQTEQENDSALDPTMITTRERRSSMILSRGTAVAGLSLALIGALTAVHQAVATHAAGVSRLSSSRGIQTTPGFHAQERPSTVRVAEVTSGDQPDSETAGAGNNPDARDQIDDIRVQVPFQTCYKQSIHVLPGHRWEWQAGKPGVQILRTRVTRVGNQIVARKVLSRRWAHRPVPAMVAVGVDPFQSSRSFSGLGRQITMIATKYDAYLGGAGSGRTCTGATARRGIVAVDPRFIPLGTHLWVEGYGYCVAGDIGSAIKGRRIDLCVSSNYEANLWGVRRVRVLILN
jgi:3D (Asp-Asp-Asp) domain-containing protein